MGSSFVFECSLGC